MKALTSRIFFITLAIIMSVLSLIFFVLNLRIFFSFDWLVYGDKVMGFFSSLSKVIIWSIGMSALPMTIIYIKNHDARLRMYLTIYSLSCFLAGVVLALIFKTDVGIPPIYYILPVSLTPTLFGVSFYFYEMNR